MSAIIEVITGRATNPAALAALTANTGDSFTVRAFGDGVRPMLLNLWSQQATAGFVRVRSNRLHDAVQGIRTNAPAANPKALLAVGSEQELFPTDTLTFEIQGGGAEVDAASMLIRYEGASASQGRFATWQQIKPLIKNYLTVQVDAAGPVTTGDWSPGTNFNNLTNLLKANTFYAILGYQTDAPCNAIAVRGADTGNFRVGGPGSQDPVETRDWFKRLSDEHGQAYIPVINSQNVGNTQTFVSRITAAGTVNVTWNMVELSAYSG
jgi:hypothetical protein